jgi:hypothetical protein
VANRKVKYIGVIDEVEYITPKNSQRMKELNLTEEDLLSGYYIYNLEEKNKRIFADF